MSRYNWSQKEINLLEQGIQENLKPREIADKYLPTVPFTILQGKYNREKQKKHKDMVSKDMDNMLLPATNSANSSGPSRGNKVKILVVILFSALSTC
jgi:hypothetical protein